MPLDIKEHGKEKLKERINAHDDARLAGLLSKCKTLTSRIGWRRCLEILGDDVDCYCRFGCFLSFLSFLSFSSSVPSVYAV